MTTRSAAFRPVAASPWLAPGALRTASVLSALTVVLLIAATLSGLIWQGLYRGEERGLLELYGRDLVTLVLVVPLLTASLAAARRGSLRALLLWMGSLACVAYLYATMAFGLAYNELFLVHVALLGLALYALTALLAGLDVERLAETIHRRMPLGLLAGYAALLGVGFVLLWGGTILADLFAGITEVRPPEPSQVLDLGIVVPALLLAAVRLWRGNTWGLVLAAVLTVQTAVLFLTVAVGQLYVRSAGLDVAWGDAGLYAAFALASAAGVALLLAWLRPGRG